MRSINPQATGIRIQDLLYTADQQEDQPVQMTPWWASHLKHLHLLLQLQLG